MARFAEFEVDEYRARTARLQELMGERGIDAVLIADEPSYRYFTGHYTESWLNRSRPCACLLPASGEPVPIVCESDAEWARCTAWCSEIVTYPGPVLGKEVLGAPEVGFEPSLAEVLVRTTRAMAGGASRIGMPLGSRSRVQLPLGVILALRQALSDVEWVDVVDLIWQTRAIKSEAELARMVAAVAALDHAMPTAIRSARAGMSEKELARIQRAALFQGGADHVGYTNVIATIEAPLFSAPSSRVMQPGKVFYIDGGAIVNGYWSDYCRLGAIGEVGPEVHDLYRRLVAALDAGMATIRAGVTAGRVAAAMEDVLAGPRENMSIGRMGHANGLEMPEPPSIHVDDETILESGMVLAVEPNLHVDGIGSMIVEDMVVVTPTGCKNLSTVPTPRELPVV